MNTRDVLLKLGFISIYFFANATGVFQVKSKHCGILSKYETCQNNGINPCGLSHTPPLRCHAGLSQGGLNTLYRNHFCSSMTLLSKPIPPKFNHGPCPAARGRRHIVLPRFSILPRDPSRRGRRHAPPTERAAFARSLFLYGRTHRCFSSFPRHSF